MKQEGVAPEAGILPRLARYESLRWYGNGTVQAALWILFLISFIANTIAGVRCSLTRLFRRQQSVALPASNRVVNLKRAISALNFLILVTFSITELLVVDQMHPSCPSVLLFVPLLGTVSTLATVGPTDRACQDSPRPRLDGSEKNPLLTRCSLLDPFCVPYMFYWNLIGVRF